MLPYHNLINKINLQIFPCGSSRCLHRKLRLRQKTYGEGKYSLDDATTALPMHSDNGWLTSCYYILCLLVLLQIRHTLVTMYYTYSCYYVLYLLVTTYYSYNCYCMLYLPLLQHIIFILATIYISWISGYTAK